MDPNISQSPPAQPQSASTESVPQILNLIFPADGEEGEVTRVRYSLRDETLVVAYEVTTRDINPEKMDDAEIYNGNVVELFICTTARPAQTPRPYYEFEVSP
jgi:hypothetical protein